MPSPIVSRYLSTKPADKQRGIIFSGSGWRAVAFHLGMGWRLAELGLLNQVDTIIGIGAGGILVGRLASLWTSLRYQGPDVSADYRRGMAEPMIEVMSERIRMPAGWWHQYRPRFWSLLRRGLFNSAQQWSLWIEKHITGESYLRELPGRPKFVFPVGELRSGKVWEMSADVVGTPTVGYLRPGSLRLSEAVAAASADPRISPPLSIAFRSKGFLSAEPSPAASRLRSHSLFMDASFLDPFGLDYATSSFDSLLIGDASEPFPAKPAYEDSFPSRIWRGYHMQGESACESARRQFIERLAHGQIQGALISLKEYHGDYGLPGSVGYPIDVVEKLVSLRADWNPIPTTILKVLVNHGYTATEAALSSFMPSMVPKPAQLSLPYPDHVDRRHILTWVESQMMKQAA